MKGSKYLLPQIFLVVGIVGGFTGGYFFKNYQQSKQIANFRQGTAQRGNLTGMGINGGQRNMGESFSGLEGEIISLDDKSITVKLLDGSSKIVYLSDNTTYLNFIDAKKNDLKQGIKVAVFGKSNADGSVTAAKLQLNLMQQTKTDK